MRNDPTPETIDHFVALYHQQYPRILAYAHRRVGGRADAEDIAAEVFRLAWGCDEIPSVGWLFVTARNLVLTHHRTTKRSEQIIERLSTETRGTGHEDDTHEIHTAMESLSLEDRELLMAVYWDDLSGTQCAQLMGCSVGAVWVRLHRARKALKTLLSTPERTRT